MRKVGILSDTEQTRNRDFKRTQLAKREHVASRLTKAKSLEKELKYADRVPTRVPEGLVRDNLREVMTGSDTRYVKKPVAKPPAADDSNKGLEEDYASAEEPEEDPKAPPPDPTRPPPGNTNQRKQDLAKIAQAAKETPRRSPKAPQTTGIVNQSKKQVRALAKLATDLVGW